MGRAAGVEPAGWWGGGSADSPGAEGRVASLARLSRAVQVGRQAASDYEDALRRIGVHLSPARGRRGPGPSGRA